MNRTRRGHRFIHARLRWWNLFDDPPLVPMLIGLSRRKDGR